MTPAIGLAVPSYNTPTDTLAIAAALNCTVPSKAEALPARSPCGPMASATEFGKTNPRLAT